MVPIHTFASVGGDDCDWRGDNGMILERNREYHSAGLTANQSARRCSSVGCGARRGTIRLEVNVGSIAAAGKLQRWPVACVSGKRSGANAPERTNAGAASLITQGRSRRAGCAVVKPTELPD